MTWAGVVVRSGTVGLTATGPDVRYPSASLNVSDRAGWTFTAASAAYLEAGPGTGACASLAQRPSEPGDLNYAGLGESCLEQNRSWSPTTISGGPNGGYHYASPTPTNTTIYQWVRTAGLNAGANFYNKQTGTYRYPDNQGGCILGSQLATNVQRHEVGAGYGGLTDWGHWGNYKHSQDSSSNNVGTKLEGSIGLPSVSETSFRDTVNNSLDNAQGTILSDTAVEPSSVEYDGTPTYRGAINWYAYGYCQ